MFHALRAVSEFQCFMRRWRLFQLFLFFNCSTSWTYNIFFIILFPIKTTPRNSITMFFDGVSFYNLVQYLYYIIYRYHFITLTLEMHR